MANDITILSGIIAILFLTGVLIPLLLDDFNIDQVTSIDQDFVMGEYEANDINEDTGITEAFFIGAGMIFWDFTDILPWWLDLLYIMLRIVGMIIIARNIWIGGGA